MHVFLCLVLGLFLFFGQNGFLARACTGFQIPKSKLGSVAVNFDWVTDQGYMILNPPGKKKVGLIRTDLGFSWPLHWTSQHFSLTLNQVGRDFPYGGMNEKGLVLQSLILENEAFTVPHELVPAINEVQWAQYLLDTSSTILEAIENAKRVRVIPAFTHLHYFACDLSLSCATFEYIRGELTIHTGKKLPFAVLTNSTYSSSLGYLKQFRGYGGHHSIPSSHLHDSLNRFVRATHLSRGPRRTSDSQFGFQTLPQIAPAGDSATRWRVVYEPGNDRILFNLPSDTRTREVSLKKLIQRYQGLLLGYNMNAGLTGDVTQAFSPYCEKHDRELLHQNGFLPQSLIDLLLGYFRSQKNSV